MASKKSGAWKKTFPKENAEQMVLIRDGTSELLMLEDVNKVSAVNKGSKLVPGIVVTWQHNSRQRWRGPILAIGTEAQCAKVMSTIENNSICNDDNTIRSKRKQGQKLQSTITVEKSDSERKQVDEDDINELPPLYIAEDEEEEVEEKETENNVSLDQNTDTSFISGNSGGAKRSRTRNTIDSSSRKKYSNSSLTVSYSEFSKKQQECLALQAQIARYEQEWMPRPKDPKVIEYLIEITDMLRGANHDNDDVNPGELLAEISTELNMSEKQLKLCKKKSATTTARHIMRFLYPTPSRNSIAILKNEAFVAAVIQYTRIANPSDPTPDNLIRRAMGNYIAAHKFKNRRN